MKYMLKVSGVRLSDANEILRFCSERGFGLPEISEDCQADQSNDCPQFIEAVKHRRERREIIMTAVSGSGESFTGCAKGVAKHIAKLTGRGVSVMDMMSLFRRGEKYRGFTAIISKDSTRRRKSEVQA